MDRVIKSVVWLTACGALGYSLLLVTSAGKTELHQVWSTNVIKSIFGNIVS